MTSAVIKLESFTAQATCKPEPLFSQQALDQARSEGLAEGLARREAEGNRTLCAALESLSSALIEDEARRHALRAEAVAALSPILTEILDALTPSVVSQRLERVLTAELQRLAAQAAPLRARISCNDQLRDLVNRCIAESGATGIELDSAGHDRITLSLQGGHIDFSQEKIAAQIRALIDDLKQDEPTWTH